MSTFEDRLSMCRPSKIDVKLCCYNAGVAHSEKLGGEEGGHVSPVPRGSYALSQEQAGDDVGGTIIITKLRMRNKY